ncbi:hypothetical protein KIW84_054622 [Lathyrus oleraceus]|uniref:Uncharacterized protein n=1 Tax=Pisum sativum TaxID=3888 RepID=A0A9D5AII3_PEA|nr:hypothetical protein KIW84_054622 [Pisum sativum]
MHRPLGRRRSLYVRSKHRSSERRRSLFVDLSIDLRIDGDPFFDLSTNLRSGGMERALVVANPKKRKLMISDDDDDDFGIRRREFRFKVLLPNGTSVELTVWSVETEMHFEDFVGLVREKYLELRKKCEWMKKKRDINWKGSGLYLEDAGDNKIRNVIELKNFMPRKCHILRLNNMWDLTPDTDLLLELPEEYNFEAAIADLIDNALQAVWFNGKNSRKIVRVNVTDDKISIFDNGSGMDDSDENSLPYFGMFGYGGPVASMHLGRRTRVSSKTKHVKGVDINKLQCRLKDIYFPYIQVKTCL